MFPLETHHVAAMSTRRASDAPSDDADDLRPSLANLSMGENNLSMGEKKRLIIQLSVTCSIDGVDRIIINQELVDKSDTVPIVLKPTKEVTIWMNHDLNDNNCLVHMLKFVGGSVSQDEKTWVIRSFDSSARRRDGGSMWHKLERRYIKREIWIPLEVQEGPKATLFKLEFEY